jgi:CelD/BcsL family acetyltransferase involved in cellulose biosynthesis
MNFSTVVGTASTDHVRGPPRRATFALEPVDSLPRLAARIDSLALRALEPNPFFLPDFLDPAIEAFGPCGLKLAIVSDREELLFFAPVIAPPRRLFGAARLRVWTHAFAPLGSPLIDRDAAPEIADEIMAALRRSGRRSLVIPDMPLKGAAARTFRAAAKHHGSHVEAGRQARPILRTSPIDAPDAFERLISAKHRRDLDRQLRRLCERGAVSVMTARNATDLEAAFTSFAVLERSGWKGRRGTAIDQDAAIVDFARDAVTRLARRGAAAIDVMRVGERPVAALIRFDHAGLSIPWKIAYDESFSAFSPGKQLMCDATRRWLLDASILRVDPVCEGSNPLMSGVFKDSEPYGALFVSTRRRDMGMLLSASLLDMKIAGRRRAKALLQRRRR